MNIFYYEFGLIIYGKTCCFFAIWYNVVVVWREKMNIVRFVFLQLHHQLSRELIENPMAESGTSSTGGNSSSRTNVPPPQISIHNTFTPQGGPAALLRPIPSSAPVSRQISEQPPRRPRLAHTLSRSHSYKQCVLHSNFHAYPRVIFCFWVLARVFAFVQIHQETLGRILRGKWWDGSV